eukprot:2651325-Pleurochrysis_carterae.AAC.1
MAACGASRMACYECVHAPLACCCFGCCGSRPCKCYPSVPGTVWMLPQRASAWEMRFCEYNLTETPSPTSSKGHETSHANIRRLMD